MHRYLAVLPSYAALVLITIAFLPQIGDGPQWTKCENIQKNCLQQWWRTIPLVDPYKMCWDHSWYIANGTIFYLLSPLLLFPLLSKGSKFILTITGIIFVQIFATIGYIYSSVDDLRGALEITQKFPLFRAGPWVVGIVVGYLYYLHKDKVVVLGKVRR